MQMRRRGLPEATVARVLAAPGQRWALRPGRGVLQARIALGDPARMWLVRVIVETSRKPPVAVTAYQTSRLEKHWRHEP